MVSIFLRISGGAMLLSTGNHVVSVDLTTSAISLIVVFSCISSVAVLRLFSQTGSPYSTATSIASWKRWRRLWVGWTIIPTGIGISVLTVLHWRRIAKDNRQTENKKTVINKFQIVCYRAVPFRALSRVWGWISSCYVPIGLRCWLYGRFADICGANIEEAADSLECYNTLCEFFVRSLKEGVRPIADVEHVVSPADGHVISAGYVNSCQVEQIKGVTYTIKSFLGDPTWWRQNHLIDSEDESRQKEDKIEVSSTPSFILAASPTTITSTTNYNYNKNENSYIDNSKSSYCDKTVLSNEYDMLELDLTASTILYKDANNTTMIGYNNRMLGWLIFYCRFCVTVLLKNSFYIGFQLIYGIKTTNSLMNDKVLSGASFLKSHFNVNLSSKSCSSLFSFSNKNNTDDVNNVAEVNDRISSTDSESDSDFESSFDRSNNRRIDRTDIYNDDDNDCGCVPPSSTICSDDAEWKDYKKKLLRNPDNKLYQLVVYLAPGDYHRFHSPVDWHVSFRRHFQGELLSVHPKISKWIPELFSLNERVVYVGEWQHGFFSMIAVGATNVGSIRVYTDETLQTNTKRWKGGVRHRDHALNIDWKKGQEVGEFRLGSTVVLLFEAPNDFKFSVHSGDRIKVGQSIVDVA